MASKRLHILRVLKRGGVPPADLIKVYFALRSAAHGQDDRES